MAGQAKGHNYDLSILSYNVHGFADGNIDDIVKMIGSYDPSIVVLQEVGLAKGRKIKDIFGYFNRLGYKDYICVANGASKMDKHNYMTSFIMIIGKEPFKQKERIDLTMTIHLRNCIVVRTASNIMIASVHLEIGQRFHHLKEDDAKRLQIEKENAETRIRELEILLKKYPKLDIIVGDFNFMPNDLEFEWLQQKGYRFAEDYEWTTPYNRVDMVFVRKGFEMGLPTENITLDADLSDHKPICSKWTH